MTKEKILLVEDDINFGTVLKSYLEMNEYEVTLVADGAQAVPTFRKNSFDLCVLDVMLPNKDGFSIAVEIRKLDEGIPLIFLTAKSLKEDILKGFQVGADDYLTKPFDSDVLMHKIKAILRRNKDNIDNLPEIITIGPYKFDHSLRTLTGFDKVYRLTPRESDLLKMLYQHKNHVLDRNHALKNIWGDDNYFNARSMDVYITKLRKYFKPIDGIEINNVHGSGFILVIKDDRAS
ncbi:MAG TPA: response regulator transcription factor [Bacteroidales bacterium]|mgnify:FL=1|jgi:DNA-binding response OmpR family regulator|nr:response regulator transcription factor [Bacteroidales bacterium]MDD4234842.1 response regulator transcription factor [Bacteroidales bacterium]MDY0159900.1 response regulator transcription factor [Bacteroidales bacterium]HXK82319.1 response regulator transcription factor [Bacteroidales bacterium]